ncbi:hypothetical protein Y032_0430g1310 [Ancylostoma ceylanicum]|nr:hypothetical protein Y032_0430g1310 [Ancylostoma ceylanicum]
MTCVSSGLDIDWSNFEQILRTVLKGLPNEEHWIAEFKKLDWETLLKGTYQDKWPTGLKWPDGLKELKEDFRPISKLEHEVAD